MPCACFVAPGVVAPRFSINGVIYNDPSVPAPPCGGISQGECFVDSASNAGRCISIQARLASR